MTDKDSSADHLENPAHEAVLTGAIALASLFSSCVEAFGLIHPTSRFDREEQLLLTRLGLQQARLLIWGSVLGVTSPPASVTNSAVPKYPSSAYPDLKEPTFFDARDPRLDDPAIRTEVENTLSSIVDRSSHHSREEMMAFYGLRPPKKYVPRFEPSLDVHRLESFRERHELLREVAESYAQINTRRTNSIVHTPWVLADVTKFGRFIDLTKEKLDYLIELMDVKEKIDRGMRMDIRLFGWHVIPDRARTAMDISKLRLLQQVCREDYPEYALATQQALDNISRESRENDMPVPVVAGDESTIEGATNPAQHKKRPGLLKILKSLGKPKSHSSGRSQSVGHVSLVQEDPGPARSQSESGPTTDSGGPALGRVRSKSVGGHLEPPILDDDLRDRLDKLTTVDTVHETPYETIDSPVEHQVIVPKPTAPPGSITRHDQYQGIARTATKDLRQPGGNFANG